MWQIKRFLLEIDLSLLFVLVEETPKVKGKRKKQKSLELEEGTHVVAEPFCLICKTPVETFNGGISSGSEKLIFRCFFINYVYSSDAWEGGSNKPPLQVNDGGLEKQAVNFQLLANSGGMENKL